MIYKPTAQTFHAPILIKKKIDATTLRTNILFHTPYQLKFTDSNSPISAPKVQKISIRRPKILKYLTQNYKKGVHSICIARKKYILLKEDNSPYYYLQCLRESDALNTTLSRASMVIFSPVDGFTP